MRCAHPPPAHFVRVLYARTRVQNTCKVRGARRGAPGRASVYAAAYTSAPRARFFAPRKGLCTFCARVRVHKAAPRPLGRARVRPWAPQGAPKGAPWRTLARPRARQGAPRCALECARARQGAPLDVPGRAKVRPRARQCAPRGALGRARASQGARNTNRLLVTLERILLPPAAPRGAIQ